MSFLAPFFLIGLGALAVPIIIHLWSKDAKQSVSFGSLRFLRETETRTSRSIMPSQWLLLVLRLLVLTLVVFLLAGPQLTSDAEKMQRLYLVDRFYQDSELVRNLMDTVGEGIEIRWLANGFPAIDEPVDGTIIDYWDLLSKLPESEAECVIVISPLHQKHFLGRSKILSTVCQWIKPPGEVNTMEIAKLAKHSKTYAVSASYDEWSTTHEIASSNDGEILEVTYFVATDSPYEKLEQIFLAAIRSIQEVSLITVSRTENADEADWLIWLSDNPVPSDRKVIATDSKVFGIEHIGRNLVKVSNNLSSDDAVKMELPRVFLNVFVGDQFEDEGNDMRTMDLEAFSFQNTAGQGFNETRDASTYLWIALLTILLLERWLSYKSNAVTV